jgi:hypothetical protein
MMERDQAAVAAVHLNTDCQGLLLCTATTHMCSSNKSKAVCLAEKAKLSMPHVNHEIAPT